MATPCSVNAHGGTCDGARALALRSRIVTLEELPGPPVACRLSYLGSIIPDASARHLARSSSYHSSCSDHCSHAGQAVHRHWWAQPGQRPRVLKVFHAVPQPPRKCSGAPASLQNHRSSDRGRQVQSGHRTPPSDGSRPSAGRSRIVGSLESSVCFILSCILSPAPSAPEAPRALGAPGALPFRRPLIVFEKGVVRCRPNLPQRARRSGARRVRERAAEAGNGLRPSRRHSRSQKCGRDVACRAMAPTATWPSLRHRTA
jgi:hypothetical protein